MPRFSFGGILEPFLLGVTEQWLLVAPKANPGMLEMFRDRNQQPLRSMVPWAGEFAGKYLVAAVQVLRTCGEPRLREWLGTFVDRLLSLQTEDGYLGPWPDACRLKNTAPNSRLDIKGHKETYVSWDTWGHYHLILGLLMWWEHSGDERARRAARGIGDRLVEEFLGAKEPRLVERGDTAMNMGILHGMTLLHHAFEEPCYLELALQWVEELGTRDADGKPLGCDLLEAALAGTEYHAMPNPRWEALHQVMAFADLFWITGEERYREAFSRIWWSIVKLDRHNNGGFSSGESAVGNPYALSPIETCCTIAWSALTVEMLKMEASPLAADELELTLFNSITGMHSETGRWSTYTTPMNGIRRASTHSIVFQAREGTPELNCCSVNAPRGFGLLSDWALMRGEDGLTLNYYGPCRMEAALPSGHSVSLTQSSSYPVGDSTEITLELPEAASFVLQLRIPHWSEHTRVEVNGETVEARPGTYLSIGRRWWSGDRIRLQFDFRLRFWKGERECEGLCSIFRGPLLLAYDMRYNPGRPEIREPLVRELSEWAPNGCVLDIPRLDAGTMQESILPWDDWHAPALLLEFRTADGEPVRLCDFASAGRTGTVYCSWLPVEGVPGPAAFSRENPTRTLFA
ncbi:MAG: beta-L-arabinofuranosidase domain-containing protein [Opitutales bacterium]